MRTDAKVGFAIAAVLLAVLFVWAIVGSKKAATKKTSTVVSVVPDTTPQTGTDPVSSGGLSGPHIDTPPVTPGPAGDRTGTQPASNLGNIIDNTMGGTQPTPPHGDNVTPPTPGHNDAGEGRQTGRRHEPRVREHTPTDSTDAHFTPVSSRKYTVKSGQTLSSIAYEVYGNTRFWVNIHRENSDIDPKNLKVGTVISLPEVDVIRPDTEVVRPTARTVSEDRVSTADEVETTARTYRVKSGDSLYRIAKNVLGSGRKADALYELNRDRIGSDKAALKVGTLLRLPAGIAGPVVLSDAGR